MADYWIKLYHEILDDPKMATLPDRLWRRAVEIFLLAGKLSKDKSGILPETKQLAWLLRIPSEELEFDLIQLASTGIIKSFDGGWVVVNFNKRQAATTSTERSQYHRERKQKQEYYDYATSPQRNVAQINRLTDNRLTEQINRAEIETEVEEEYAATENFKSSDICNRIWVSIRGKGTMIPPSQRDKIEPVVWESYQSHQRDEDKTVREGKKYFEDWCGRRSKSGAFYNPDSIGWVDWWANGSLPSGGTNGNFEPGPGGVVDL